VTASNNFRKYGYYANLEGWYVNTPISHTTDFTAAFSPKQLEEVVYEATITDWMKLEVCCDGLFIFNFHAHTEYTIEESDDLRASAIKLLNVCKIFNTCSVLLRTAISNHEGYACPYNFITPSQLYTIQETSTSPAKDTYHIFQQRFEHNIHKHDHRFYTVGEETLAIFVTHLKEVVTYSDKTIFTFSRSGSI